MNSDERVKLLLYLLEELSEHRDFSGCEICAPIVLCCIDAECHCPELLNCPGYKNIRADIENILFSLTAPEIDMVAYLKSRGSRNQYQSWLETLNQARINPIALTIH